MPFQMSRLPLIKHPRAIITSAIILFTVVFWSGLAGLIYWYVTPASGSLADCWHRADTLKFQAAVEHSDDTERQAQAAAEKCWHWRN
jgi:hypothetical protein